MTNLCKQVRFLCCSFALLGPGVFGQSAAQTQPPSSQQPPAAQQPPAVPAATRDNVPVTESTPLPPRFSAGFRVEYYPGRLFATQDATSSSTNPILSNAYFGTAVGSKLTFGVTAEYRITTHLFVAGDFYFHQAEFVQLTQTKSGLPDPNSSYDNRPITSVNEDTRAEYWDVPVVARYYAPGGKRLKFLSQTYIFGGVAYRHVGNIRTGTSTSLPDGTTSYNEIPAVPNKSNLVGAVGGAGYKLFEYGKFKSLIEARYTRWFGYSFQGPGYASERNQIEYGLSITY